MIGLVGIDGLDNQGFNLLGDDCAGSAMGDMGGVSHHGDVGCTAAAPAPTKETS